MADLTRRKLTFAKSASMEAQRLDRIATLRLDFTERWGRDAIIDLTSLEDRPELARSLALALSGICEPDGTVKRLPTARSYEMALKCYFWPFLADDENNGHPRALRSQEITTETLERYRAWLNSRRIALSTAVKEYTAVVVLFRYLKNHYPRLVDATLDPPRRAYPKVQQAKVHRPPYSDREVLAIERAARDDIERISLRLTRQKEALLSLGEDPRSSPDGWKDKTNLIWYVQNVLDGQYLSSKELRAAGHRKLADAYRGPCFRKEIYGCLYPLLEDLVPFLILLSLKTGLNPQSLLDLRRDCLTAVPERGKVRLTYFKYRPVTKIHQSVFPDRSAFDVGGLIRTVLKITEPALPFISEADRDHLWIGVLAGECAQGFCRISSASQILSVYVRDFAARHELKDDDGKPLVLRLSRFRPTRLTKRYRIAGNLAAARKDAKHLQAQTTVGYVNNPQTRHIHEQTIADAQQDFYLHVSGKILTQSPDDPDQVEQAALKIETTTKRAKAILRGQQDVFIAACKDFYNRPGGPADTPCDRPWACFMCRNAIWTSNTLPRLICFLEFIISQRNLLSGDDWVAKFGYPYRVITEHILPAFPPTTVEAARLAAPHQSFYAPVHLKTT
jgi:hypothetical protein